MTYALVGFRLEVNIRKYLQLPQNQLVLELGADGRGLLRLVAVLLTHRSGK